MFFLKKKSKESPSEMRDQVFHNSPAVDVLILNWNRCDLLERTLNSLLITSPGNFSFIIVDNGSMDDSRKWIENTIRSNPRVTAVFNNENMGGLALNPILKKSTAEFIMISENDLEYKPKWFVDLLLAFKLFPNLGQISPFSPFPDFQNGEIWGVKDHLKIEKCGEIFYQAVGNVGTSGMIRSEVIRKGVHWKNIVSESKDVKMPSDGEFSLDIKKKGYLVFWSYNSQVINLGHSKEQWKANSEYYLNNWKTKSNFHIDGLGYLEKIKSEVEQVDNSLKVERLFLELGSSYQECEALRSRCEYLQSKIQDSDVLKSLGLLKENSRLYLDLGKGFHSNLIDFCDFIPGTEINRCKFSLNKYSSIKSMRWDPVEGKLCRIQLLRVWFLLRDGSEYELATDTLKKSKYKIYNDNWIEFLTTDPMVFIPAHKDAEILNVEFKYQKK